MAKVDWTTTLLSGLGGGVSTYKQVKDEQRKYQMDQAAKQAEMERRMHFEEISRQKEFDFNKENAGVLESAKAKAAMELDMSQEAKQYRKEKFNEGLELETSQEAMDARKKKDDADLEKAIAIKNAEVGIEIGADDTKMRNRAKLMIEEREKLFKDIETTVDKMEGVTDETKEAIKTKGRLQIMGVTLPKVENASPADLINAREGAVKELENYDDQQIDSYLRKIGVPHTREDQRKIMTDLLSVSYLTGKDPRSPATTSRQQASPESIAQAIKNSPDQEAALKELDQKASPALAIKVRELLNDNKTPEASKETGGVLSKVRNSPGGSFFGNITKSIGEDFSKRAESKGWTVK